MTKIPKATAAKYNKSVGTMQKIKNTLIAIRARLGSNKAMLADVARRAQKLENPVVLANVRKLTVAQQKQEAQYKSLASKFGKVTAMMGAAKKAVSAIARGAKKTAGAVVGKMKTFGQKYKLFGKKNVADLGELDDLGILPITMAVGAVVVLAAATASLLTTVNTQRGVIEQQDNILRKYEEAEVGEEEEPEEEGKEGEEGEEEPESEDEE